MEASLAPARGVCCALMSAYHAAAATAAQRCARPCLLLLPGSRGRWYCQGQGTAADWQGRVSGIRQATQPGAQWLPPLIPPSLSYLYPLCQVLEVLNDSVVRRLSEVQQENAAKAAPAALAPQKQQEQAAAAAAVMVAGMQAAAAAPPAGVLQGRQPT